MRSLRPTLDGLEFSKISGVSLESLEKDFSMDEIKGALESLEGDKAPGHDGFNFAFFKARWEIVGQDTLDSSETSFMMALSIKALRIPLLP